MLYLKGKSGESYNVGSGVTLSNVSLIIKLLKICKMLKIKIDKKTKIVFVKDRPGHDFRYALDSKKIKKELKWSPQINLQRGLLDTVEWYQNNKVFLKKISKILYDKRLGLKL